MVADDRRNNIPDETTNSDKDTIVPDVSFLEELSNDTLKLVELIMATSTGQKDIIDQLKLTASA